MAATQTGVYGLSVTSHAVVVIDSGHVPVPILYPSMVGWIARTWETLYSQMCVTLGLVHVSIKLSIRSVRRRDSRIVLYWRTPVKYQIVILSVTCSFRCCPSSTEPGGWSGWSVWSPCSRSCGSGSTTRRRTCTAPPPSYGGADCAGEGQERKACKIQDCCKYYMFLCFLCIVTAL